jgi:hypothetical protein
MFKMGLHVPFEYSKHKLWLKERLESKCQFDCQPLKVGNHLDLLTCNILLESSQQGLQLCCRPHFNQGFAQNVMGLQNCRSPNFGNFKIPNLGVQDRITFGCRPHGQA